MRRYLITACSVVGLLAMSLVSIAETSTRRINSGVPFLDLQDSVTVLEAGADIAHLKLYGDAKVIVEDGAEVSHLHAYDDAYVAIEKGADLSHVTLFDDASVEIRGKVSTLTLHDRVSGMLDGASITGGSHSGTAMGNVQVVLGSAARLDLLASDVRFHEHVFAGRWRDQHPFSFAVGLNLGSDERPQHRPARTWPAQVRVVEVGSPSFDCSSASLSNVEKMICGNVDLGKLDRQLADRYADAVEQTSASTALRTEQRAWLRSRNACRSVECIERLSRERLTALIWLTGRFERPFAEKLCGKFLDPSSRRSLLEHIEGSEDVNNDGKAERVESCWGGTMNAPCIEYFDADGKQLQIEQQGFEWKDYWTFGEQRFRFEGKTFVYHSFESVNEPAHLSYVSPLNREFVVCDFDNSFSSDLRKDGPSQCDSFESDRVAPIGLVAYSGEFAGKLPRETHVKATGVVDVDNDGKADRVAELSYSSGAGRGCDMDYFVALVTDEEVAASGRAHDVLQALQESTSNESQCRGARNRFLELDGKTYFEFNFNNARGSLRRIRLAEHERLTTVCEYDQTITTTIGSIH